MSPPLRPLRYPSYDPAISFQPERPLVVKFRHGLPRGPLLTGYTSQRVTPPLRPEGALLAGAGPVMGRCVPEREPLPCKMPEGGKSST